MKKFKKEAILNILFPRRCPVCGGIVKPAGRLICPSCFRELSFVKSPTCKKCGKEIEDETMEFCEDCMAHRHTFEYGMALLNYNDAAKNSMVQIKYHNKREYLDFYGAALAVRFEREIRKMKVDAIVPVPVHPSRRRKRGFNQAEVLAKILGERLGIPVKSELLKRTKKTLPQKELTVGERLKNLSGAFWAGEIPSDIRRVLLVDDIYTTGSTVEACTRVLKASGVETIYFVVICMAGGR
ncbi:MAG: ComF family protein [Lachnospiraceae bacterium]|nr:ComF family protein [Lachnospiraceae bacterium]